MIYYGIIITGTDTGVGKTEIASGLARAFRAKGVKVGVFKPVETGCQKKRGKLIAQDAKKLLRASGANLKIDQVAPYRFSLPASPLACARAEGKKILFEKIFQTFDELAGEFEMMIVEGAGGLLVPVNENFLFADLVKPMHLPLLLVAENRLGVINQTLLTLESSRSRGLEILGVILNQTRPGKIPEKLMNKKLIEEWGKVKVLAQIPYLPAKSREKRMVRICQKILTTIEPIIRETGKKSISYYL